jgi:hypothetical protein
MEASSASPLIMSRSEFLFQVLVVALGAPTGFRHVDQRGSACGRGGEPVFRNFRLSFWPFDQTLFLDPRRYPVIIVNVLSGRARRRSETPEWHWFPSPGHAAPSTGGQADREFLRGNRLSYISTTDQRRRRSVLTPFLWWQSMTPGGPQAYGELNADHIKETERGDSVTKFGVDTISGIGAHRRGCDTARRATLI